MSNKQAIAYHEAGHAVAAFVLGYKPTLVTIQPYRDTDGRVHFRTIHLYAWSSEAKTLIERHDRCEKSIIISLAGPVAEPPWQEKLDVDSNPHWAGDLERVDVVLEKFVAPRLHSKVLQDLAWRTSNLLRRHWHAVEIVAEALMQVKRLNRREMIELMECAG